MTSFAALALTVALQAGPAAVQPAPPLAAPAPAAPAPPTPEEAAEAAAAPTPGDHSVPLFNPAAIPEVPGAPPMTAAAYDAAFKAAFDAQQALYGPLDGGWLLVDAAGTGLYHFEITDPGAAAGPASGAWRDMKRPAAIDGTGYFRAVRRRGDAVVLRFHERPGWFDKVIVLRPAADGAWRGRLRAGLRVRSVVMRRS